MTSSQENPGKFKELIQWLMEATKSQGILSICLGSQGIIAWSYALESTTHMLLVLQHGEFKRKHKIVLNVFLCTSSLGL